MRTRYMLLLTGLLVVALLYPGCDCSNQSGQEPGVEVTSLSDSSFAEGTHPQDHDEPGADVQSSKEATTPVDRSQPEHTPPPVRPAFPIEPMLDKSLPPWRGFHFVPNEAFIGICFQSTTTITPPHFQPYPDPLAKRQRYQACAFKKEPPGDNCEATLRCRRARMIDGRASLDQQVCVSHCNSTTRCQDKESCVEPIAQSYAYRMAPCSRDHPLCFCATLRQEGERCQPSKGIMCGTQQSLPAGTSLLCVANQWDELLGTCLRTCAQTSDCAVPSKEICRPMHPGDALHFCLPPVQGASCLGQRCDFARQACQWGLVCIDGHCATLCDQTNATTTCDQTKGEICNAAKGASGHCQSTSTIVTKAGALCSPQQPCDPTKDLVCLSVGTRSICIRRCDVTKGTTNNPACQPAHLCKKSHLYDASALCHQPIQHQQPCHAFAICAEATDRCIEGFANSPAACFKLCQLNQNTSYLDNLNPRCDDGKSLCYPLWSTIEANGNDYNGACLPPRPKTIAIGGACTPNPALGDLRASDCVEGAFCADFEGEAPICARLCDPSEMRQRGTQWLHPLCSQGTQPCIIHKRYDCPIAYVCQPPPQNKTKERGEPCNLANSCKTDNLVCIRWEPGFPKICSQLCNPGKGTEANEDCRDGERCMGTPDGGGVCIPPRPKTRQSGQSCQGTYGTDSYDDCARQDTAGRALYCLKSPHDQEPGRCQFVCDAGQGRRENPSCKAAGRNGHLCLDLGGQSLCLAPCQWSDTNQCIASTCPTGTCQQIATGPTLDCTDPTVAKTCQGQGGTCFQSRCVYAACY